MPRKSRLYVGVMPEDGGRWLPIAKVSCEGIAWRLFWDPETRAGEWHELRLVAVGGAPNKASYWLGWGIDQQRFRKGGDGAKLLIHRPALGARVAEKMREFHRVKV